MVSAQPPVALILCILRHASAMSHPHTNAKLRVGVDAWKTDAARTHGIDGDIDTWNVLQIADIHRVFQQFVVLNEPISKSNIGSVTTTEGMFYSASAFNQPVLDLNTGSVTTMEGMFSLASAFNHPAFDCDIGSVTTVYEMFYPGSTFNQPMCDWNTGSVTSMAWMFYVVSAFNQPVCDWNTGSVTTMEGMFDLASKLFSAIASIENAGDWNTGSVTSMEEMLDCSIGSVTTMHEMFYSASAFNQPVGDRMFYFASAFNRLVRDWITGSVTTMAWMFFFAIAYKQLVGDWSTCSISTIKIFLPNAFAFCQTPSALPGSDYAHMPLTAASLICVSWATCLCSARITALLCEGAHRASPSWLLCSLLHLLSTSLLGIGALAAIPLWKTISRSVRNSFEACSFVARRLKRTWISLGKGLVLRSLNMLRRHQQHDWVATLSKTIQTTHVISNSFSMSHAGTLTFNNANNIIIKDPCTRASTSARINAIHSSINHRELGLIRIIFYEAVPLEVGGRRRTGAAAYHVDLTVQPRQGSTNISGNRIINSDSAWQKVPASRRTLSLEEAIGTSCAPPRQRHDHVCNFSFIVYVKPCRGETAVLRGLHADSTIDELLSRINAHLTEGKVDVVYSGKTLTVGCLKDYGVQNTSTLHLVARLCGGGKWGAKWGTINSASAVHGVEIDLVCGYVPIVMLPIHSEFYTFASSMLQASLAASGSADSLYVYTDDPDIYLACSHAGYERDNLMVAHMREERFKHVRAVGSTKRSIIFGLVLSITAESRDAKIKVMEFLKSYQLQWHFQELLDACGEKWRQLPSNALASGAKTVDSISWKKPNTVYSEASDVEGIHGVAVKLVRGSVPIVKLNPTSVFFPFVSSMIQVALESDEKANDLYEYVNDAADICESCRLSGFNAVNDLLIGRLKGAGRDHIYGVGASGKRSTALALIIAIALGSQYALGVLLEFLKTSGTNGSSNLDEAFLEILRACEQDSLKQEHDTNQQREESKRSKCRNKISNTVPYETATFLSPDECMPVGSRQEASTFSPPHKPAWGEDDIQAIAPSSSMVTPVEHKPQPSPLLVSWTVADSEPLLEQPPPHPKAAPDSRLSMKTAANASVTNSRLPVRKTPAPPSKSGLSIPATVADPHVDKKQPPPPPPKWVDTTASTISDLQKLQVSTSMANSDHLVGQLPKPPPPPPPKSALTTTMAISNPRMEQHQAPPPKSAACMTSGSSDESQAPPPPPRTSRRSPCSMNDKRINIHVDAIRDTLCVAPSQPTQTCMVAPPTSSVVGGSGKSLSSNGHHTSTSQTSAVHQGELGMKSQPARTSGLVEKHTRTAAAWLAELPPSSPNKSAIAEVEDETELDSEWRTDPGTGEIRTCSQPSSTPLSEYAIGTAASLVDLQPVTHIKHGMSAAEDEVELDSELRTYLSTGMESGPSLTSLSSENELGTTAAWLADLLPRDDEVELDFDWRRKPIGDMRTNAGSESKWSNIFSNDGHKITMAKLDQTITDSEMCSIATFLEKDYFPQLHLQMPSSYLWFAELNLGGNDLRDTGVKAVLRALIESAVQLRSLKLQDNRIGSAGIEAVAELITESQLPPEEIYLSQNLLGPSDVRRLMVSVAYRHEYPLHGQQPLWLCVERQQGKLWDAFADQGSWWQRTREMIAFAEQKIIEIRQKIGRLPDPCPADLGSLLCLPEYGSRCTSAACVHQHKYGPLIQLPFMWEQGKEFARDEPLGCNTTADWGPTDVPPKKSSLVSAVSAERWQACKPAGNWKNEVAVHKPAEKRDIEVVYQSADVMVLNKGPGWVCKWNAFSKLSATMKGFPKHLHLDSRSWEDMLSSRGPEFFDAYLARRFDDEMTREWWEWQKNPGKGREAAAGAGFVHRLDKDTSGCIVRGRTLPSFHSLKSQLHRGGFRKHYVCLVHSHVPGDDQRHEIKVRLASNKNKANDSGPIHAYVDEESGEWAETRAWCLAHFSAPHGRYSLCEVRILTGRTHQIRVHLEHKGWPLVSDTKYNSLHAWRDMLWCPRIFLHAYTVSFVDSEKDVTVFARVPEDLRDALHSLKLERDFTHGHMQTILSESWDGHLPDAMLHEREVAHDKWHNWQ